LRESRSEHPTYVNRGVRTFPVTPPLSFITGTCGSDGDRLRHPLCQSLAASIQLVASDLIGSAAISIPLAKEEDRECN
jgi:hypothetical protein